MKFCTAIKHLTNFRTTDLKLLLRIQILRASILNLFDNTHPPGFETHEFQNFFFYSNTISTQTIYVNQKLHTLSRFATLRAIQICPVFFIHPVVFVNETWLSANINNDEILHSSYTIVRNYREGRGGGVMLGIKTELFKSLREIKRFGDCSG